jgi:exopolyphosphatase / guanosine-5'-triphosphate,3'-diphosphate pyrophosphatase
MSSHFPPTPESSPLKRVASIDIGTNTILLLIADADHATLKPLLEKETVVRLGEGLQKSGVLSAEAMDRGMRTLDEYLRECNGAGVQTIFTVGTSALREAKNSGDFLERAREKLGLSIEVISGEEEAHLSFLAVAADLKEPTIATMVIDVGGGSTEFILGKGHRITHGVSLPLGLVRFTEQFLISDPVREEEWEEMREWIQKMLPGIPHPKEPFSLVSIGGTGTTLASVAQGLTEFIPGKIHHFILTRDEIRAQLLLYRSQKTEERKKIPGLPPARADVILAGGTILYAAMEELECPSVLISSHGVRYGLLYQRLHLGNPVY